MKHILWIVLIWVLMIAMRSEKPAYRLYNAKGKPVTYEELLTDARAADIILFGELHDLSVVHWLEYELMADLYQARGKELILGAEMFEADNQLIIDEYLGGKVMDKNFESEARLWQNYKIDYKPLLSFARDSGLAFIATNIPRRYAALVNRKGFEGLDSLSPEAKRWIAPLPVAYDPELACYKDIIRNMGNTPSHVTQNIARAQAIKDATMAHFILANFKPGSVFLHFNGSYHSDNFQGIVWYLQRTNPDLKILTISSVQQPDLREMNEEWKGKGNYILVVPESMNKNQ